MLLGSSPLLTPSFALGTVRGKGQLRYTFSQDRLDLAVMIRVSVGLLSGEQLDLEVWRVSSAG